ncbi:hypothetical protein SAMN05660463_01973 [Pseudomonas sp. URIL14HWK12:I9]|nr:hypothetical protein F474_02619 [Pseudomonas sp. URIL14HWK12:I12]PVZ23844.1 hypothetical protein F470_02274 [Pseudomonas sp. URIL14HWK12:I10]PVZ33517.1 hypothetical protein F472_02988 [Pseudomonas sp. URIL14HWK12:I11]SNZ11884.1 hypothetical protein SAMN05660463_01973 [Pseudomonas sp. URIL14HWK12:I9]
MMVAHLRVVPNDRTLDSWKLHWIHDETTIHCRRCLASQSVFDASQPFVHNIGCGRGDAFSHYPWQDLAAILKAQLQQA